MRFDLSLDPAEMQELDRILARTPPPYETLATHHLRIWREARARGDLHWAATRTQDLVAQWLVPQAHLLSPADVATVVRLLPWSAVALVNARTDVAAHAAVLDCLAAAPAAEDPWRHLAQSLIQGPVDRARLSAVIVEAMARAARAHDPELVTLLAPHLAAAAAPNVTLDPTAATTLLQAIAAETPAVLAPVIEAVPAMVDRLSVRDRAALLAHPDRDLRLALARRLGAPSR